MRRVAHVVYSRVTIKSEIVTPYVLEHLRFMSEENREKWNVETDSYT